MIKTIKTISTASLTALIGLALLIPQVFAAPNEVKVKTFNNLQHGPVAEYVSDEVIVKFKNDSVPFRVQKVNPGQSVSQAVNALAKNPNVEYAEPNYITQATFVPNDPYYDPYQWNFKDDVGGVQAESAWDISDGAGTVVAVIDTGVAYENYTRRHGRVIFEEYTQAPDLSGTCFVDGYDFVNNDSHPNDDNGHGTHVTGTIAQTTNNGKGAAGLAHKTCIMPIKGLSASGGGTYGELINSIYFATDNGADVINMSLSGSSYSAALEEAVAYAYTNGVVVVAATGNEADELGYVDGFVGYPAAHDEYVIAVGAIDSSETRASFSNYGSSIDIVAPGVGIVQQTLNVNTGDVNDFGFWSFSGTSMATPHVAAAAAMVMSHGNVTTPDEVRSALETTAKDLGGSDYDEYYGNGLLNVAAALAWTSGPVEPVPNLAPEADFTFTTKGLEVTFTDASSDQDGSVDSWSWDFGDGLVFSTAQNPIYTYSTPGTYMVTLKVTDDDSATTSVTREVTVNEVVEPPVTGIVLSYTQEKVRGTKYVTLSWKPSGLSVDVYRNGLIVDESNGTDAFYDENLGKGGGSYIYQVCEAGGTSTCSSQVTVVF